MKELSPAHLPAIHIHVTFPELVRMAMLRRAIAILFVVIWLARPSFSGEPGGETARKQDNHESTELGDRIQRLGDLANVGSVTSSAANSVVLSSDLIAKLKDAIKAKIEAPFQAFNEAQQDGDLETMAKASDEWMLLLKKTKANREDPNVRFMACLADSCRRMVQLPEEHRDEIRQAFRFGTEADAFLAEKRYPEAVERGKQATAIYSKHLSESDCVAVLSRFACGRILVLAGENQLALQDSDRAVENCAGGPTGRTVFYTAMLEEQAEICRYLKEQERLLVCLRRTATAYKEVTGGQSTQHVTSLRILATELLKMESFEEAGRVCQEAFQSTEPVKASLDLARELERST